MKKNIIKPINIQFQYHFTFLAHLFRRPVEILTNHFYTLASNFSYVDSQNQGYERQNLRIENDQKYQPIETVWGGGGEKMINAMETNSKFHFEKISRHDVRSSWANGQIPILYYI